MAACSSSFEHSDVLMIDPFLDYINQMLMEEGMDDAKCMQYVQDPSYQAIFSSFSHILGEPSLPTDSTRDVLHQSACWYHGNGPHDEQRASVPYDGLYPSSKALTSDVAVCMDAVVDSLGTYIGQEEGCGNPKAHVGQDQGKDKLQLPSEDEKFSSKLADVDLMSFEDLKLDDVYTDLYRGGSSISPRVARESKQNDTKGKPGKGIAPCKKDTCIDVKDLLVACAEAAAIGDANSANTILQEICQVHGASANGSALQRTAFFFGKALALRMSGMGEEEYRAMSHNMPPTGMLLNASKVGFEVAPFVKLMHYFANQSILKAAEGASRLHIVDYGSMYGMQWPCLMKALADCEGGPPLLVITCVEFPQPGSKTAEMLDETGRRLASYAKSYNIPFQYHATVSDKWEAASLHLHEGEVLVINCIKRLRHLADESADLALTISPRQKFLTHLHRLNPHLLITGVVSAAYNATFFVSRFREALYYFSNLFDMLDTLWGDTPQRLLVERNCFYRDILNIVACEGAERVERAEIHRQWHVLITRAGFEQMPIPPAMMSRSKSHVKQHYHKEFLVNSDANGWMVMGWKGRTTLAISAWKPKVLKGNPP